MDCNEYIESHLSAHADGELAPDEARTVEEHVRGCERCQAALAEERALKALIHRRLGERKVPAAVAARIRQALDGAAPDSVSINGPRPGTHAAAAPQARRRRAWVWIPTAIAAAVAIAMVLSRGNFAPYGSVPLFDQAATKLAAFQADFTPNVPSGSEMELAHAYDAARMPSGIWNFKTSGFRLVGGRVDTTPDGRRVTYTIYRGPSREIILCMRFRGAVEMAIPKDAIMRMAGHAFYRYRGLSLCVTFGPNQRFTCILASPVPIERFERIVAAAAVDHHS